MKSKSASPDVKATCELCALRWRDRREHVLWTSAAGARRVECRLHGGGSFGEKQSKAAESAAVPSGEVEHRSSSIKAGWAQERRAAPSLPPFFADVGRSSRSCSWRPRSPSPTRPEQRREATSRATVGRPQEVLDAAFAIMKIAVASRCHLDKRRALKSREEPPPPPPPPPYLAKNAWCSQELCEERACSAGFRPLSLRCHQLPSPANVEARLELLTGTLRDPDPKSSKDEARQQDILLQLATT